jgi:predicted transcriptional regulator
MEPECKKITRVVLPAVRAAVAQSLKEKHHYSQVEIAKKLGIVQVAVSKYINGRYSEEVEKVKRKIAEKGIGAGLVEEIVKGMDSGKIAESIEHICAEIAMNGFSLG